MKKIIFLSFLFIAATLGFGQSSSLNAEMLELQRASRNPLLTANSEVILVGETPWERLYGEREFTLTPSVENINDYIASVRELAKNQGENANSRFEYFNVVINANTRAQLLRYGINVPNYFQGNDLKVLLPICHYNELKKARVNIEFDLSYGENEFLDQSSNQSQVDVVFYSEGFETETVPGDLFSSSILGSANCGWGDESCNSFTGTWSVWCSGNGAGCTSCTNGGNHVSDIVSTFMPVSWINVSGYTNRVLSFMIWSDLNDADGVDQVIRYYAGNNAANFSVSGDIFTSSSSIDEAGWTLRTASITGYSTYKYGFNFTSDWSLNSDGVYIDDIKITGTTITGIEDENSYSTLIFPNPASNMINLKLNETPERVEILDINGRVVLVSNFQKQMDITSLPFGLYTIRAFLNSDVITEKFIKE
jgi:hypothetical protein